MSDREPTPASQIERWQQLKTHLTAQSKAFADYCKPFKDEQEQIENWLLDFLNKTGQNSAKTESGTAYKSTITTPKVVDREKYLDAVLDHWEDFGNAMLQVSAPQVAALEEYMQKSGGLPPPGTEVSNYVRLNIRKS